MIAACTNCQARYQLEDGKVPARIIQVRCPACQGVFSLDGNLALSDELPVQAPSAFEPSAPLVEPSDPKPFQPLATEPEPEPKPEPKPEVVPAPMVQPAAVVEPASVAPIAAVPEPVASSAPAAAGVAVLDEPTTAVGSGRRRRCKEEMLARALVSDILVYNRETRDAGLEEGNLLEALGGEIKKSWELYKEKVTPEVANSTTYFREALNEILAGGKQVF